MPGDSNSRGEATSKMAQNEKRPVVGLALGGGMARGCSHVGVLREFEKHQIPIDLIAGTSVGSLIGGAYAAGLTPDQVEKLALNISWSDLGRATVSLTGFYNSERTESYIRKHFPITEFEKTRIPFGAVATDLQTGKMVVFTEGSIPLAIRASCAMPVFYTPVMVNGRMMVDGGLVGHIPGAVARMMGADIVIAVDVNSQHLPIPQPTNLFTIMSQSLSVMGRSNVNYLYADADVVVAGRSDARAGAPHPGLDLPRRGARGDRPRGPARASVLPAGLARAGGRQLLARPVAAVGHPACLAAGRLPRSRGMAVAEATAVVQPGDHAVLRWPFHHQQRGRPRARVRQDRRRLLQRDRLPRPDGPDGHGARGADVLPGGARRA